MQYRHPPIQEHLVYSHLICMYMSVNVHICSIYSVYIYVCVCIMLFSEITILFNQNFIVVGNIVGKSLTGILTYSNHIYLVVKPLKNPGRHSIPIY